MIILRAEDKPDLDGGCKCSVIYDSPVILDGGSLDSVDTYVLAESAGAHVDCRSSVFHGSPIFLDASGSVDSAGESVRTNV